MIKHEPITSPGPRTELLQPNQEKDLSMFDRVRLGGDEPAICAAIELAPRTNPNYSQDLDDITLVLIDVGFREAGGGMFGPYDLDGSGQKREFWSDYVLLRTKQTEDGPTTLFYEVPSDVEVELGRHSQAARALGYADGTGQHVSAKHAILKINGRGASIKDEGSTNGTRLKNLSDLEAESTNTDGFGYTISIGDYISRAGRGHHYKTEKEVAGWGYGMYGDRPIIARDTPINKGVYPVGGTHGEAIVVDDEKYPALFNSEYSKILDTINSGHASRFAIKGLRSFTRQGRGTDDRTEAVLASVFDRVSQILTYDLERTNALARDSQKISLDYYMGAGVGVCRTQAILSAYFVERLTKDGFLDGRISVDRNMKHDVDGGSGHAWARYTTADNQVYIIDPAQQYVGSLEEARKNPRSWDYRRTEDLIKELVAN